MLSYNGSANFECESCPQADGYAENPIIVLPVSEVNCGLLLGVVVVVIEQHRGGLAGSAVIPEIFDREGIAANR